MKDHSKNLVRRSHRNQNNRYSRCVTDYERQRQQLQRPQSNSYGDAIRPDIRVVVRNLAPVWICDGCGTDANVHQVDPVEFGTSYCDHCAEEFQGSDIGLLLIGNSPRVGMCGWEPDDTEGE